MSKNGEHEDGSASDPAGCRLATYGSLAPGRPNAAQLAALDGRWSEGQVHGTLVDAGWGAGLGFPALILDPTGSAIPVHIFESMHLLDHWSRLDEFEGPGYARVVTKASTSEGEVDVSIYVLRT